MIRDTWPWPARYIRIESSIMLMLILIKTSYYARFYAHYARFKYPKTRFRYSLVAWKMVIIEVWTIIFRFGGVWTKFEKVVQKIATLSKIELPFVQFWTKLSEIMLDYARFLLFASIMLENILSIKTAYYAKILFPNITRRPTLARAYCVLSRKLSLT